MPFECQINICVRPVHATCLCCGWILWTEGLQGGTTSVGNFLEQKQVNRGPAVNSGEKILIANAAFEPPQAITQLGYH